MVTLQGTLFAVRLKFFGYIETNTSPMTLTDILVVTISCTAVHLSIYSQLVGYNSGTFNKSQLPYRDTQYDIRLSRC